MRSIESLNLTKVSAVNDSVGSARKSILKKSHKTGVKKRGRPAKVK